MQCDIIHIVYLGFSSLLYGSASGEKARLICRALIEENVHVTIVSKSWIQPNQNETINSLKSEGIEYISVLGNRERPKSFIKRNFQKAGMPLREFIALKKLNKTDPLLSAIVVTRSFSEIIFYRLVSWVLKFSLVINYMEYNSAMVTRNKLKFRINDFFYNKFTFRIVDAGLPISEFLNDYLKRVNPRLPVYKTPVLVNTELFSDIQANENYKFILFCGGAGFSEVIEFIIRAFELLSDHDVCLHINSFGTSAELNHIRKIIANSKKSELINFTFDLEYSELIKYYKSALALLIPLRPTIQDKARFPHKIGEYAASGRPIISNNFGEMAFYFEDGKSALLAEEYEHQSLADKMTFVINNPEKANEIGREGRQVADRYFNYKKFGKGLLDFLINIKN
jgi:glycosyltransferase involved in cell wall biosynthesis